MLVMSHYSALKYGLKRGAWGTWLEKVHHCPSPLIAGDGNHGAPQVFTCPLLGLVPLRGRLCPGGACAPSGASVNPGIEGRKA